MKYLRTAGSTSNIFQVFIQDSSSTTGAGLTGLTNASASLVAYYHRDTDTTATAISLVTMTVGTFTSSGFKEIDATNMPGWYQFCPPDEALATGAKSVAIHLKGATNMAPLPMEIDLDPQVDIKWVGGNAIVATNVNGALVVDIGYVAGTAAAVAGTVDANVVSMATSGLTDLFGTSMSSFEAGAAKQSLCGATLKLTSKFSLDETANLATTYQIDGVTQFMQQAITTDSTLVPVKSLGVGA